LSKLKQITVTVLVDESLAEYVGRELKEKAKESGLTADFSSACSYKVEDASAPFKPRFDIRKDFPRGTRVTTDAMFGTGWSGVQRPEFTQETVGKVVGYRSNCELGIIVEFSLKKGLKTNDGSDFMPADGAIQYYYSPLELKKVKKKS